MITRLVKMTFEPSRIDEFLKLFSENKESIAGFKGCQHLELLRDTIDQNVFFTISRWESIADLENYRKSELFNSVWTRTKELFYSKAEAWTLH
ncbi:MAG TPA: antibiotic biosynthesis monooxygenase family protein [Bacteroidia bacterium]|nr:antibiotic biosynthesis monooxygenase family protein [Bacteroidia bacterium]